MFIPVLLRVALMYRAHSESVLHATWAFCASQIRLTDVRLLARYGLAYVNCDCSNVLMPTYASHSVQMHYWCHCCLPIG